MAEKLRSLKAIRRTESKSARISARKRMGWALMN
jgi:hypothetical protein